MEKLTIHYPAGLKITQKTEINLLILEGGEKIFDQKISITSFLDILRTAILAPFSGQTGGIKSTTDQEGSI